MVLRLGLAFQLGFLLANLPFPVRSLSMHMLLRALLSVSWVDLNIGDSLFGERNRLGSRLVNNCLVCFLFCVTS